MPNSSPTLTPAPGGSGKANCAFDSQDGSKDGLDALQSSRRRAGTRRRRWHLKEAAENLEQTCSFLVKSLSWHARRHWLPNNLQGAIPLLKDNAARQFAMTLC